MDDEAKLQALLEMLAQVGTEPDAQALLMDQRQAGMAQAATPSAQGMNVGGTYRASSPLEHMAVALQRAMGGRATKQAETGYGESLKRQQAARLAAMRGFQGLGQPSVTAMPEMYIGQEPVTEVPPMWIGLGPKPRVG